MFIFFKPWKQFDKKQKNKQKLQRNNKTVHLLAFLRSFQLHLGSVSRMDF